jgi:hypothetical protein
VSVVPHLILKPLPATIAAVHCHGVDYARSPQVDAFSLSTKSLRWFADRLTKKEPGPDLADAIVGTTVNLTPILFFAKHIVKLPVVRLPAREHQGRPSGRACLWTFFQPTGPELPQSLFVKEGFQGVDTGGYPSS